MVIIKYVVINFRHGSCHGNVNRRSQKRVPDRIEIARPDHAVFEQRGVPFQIKADGIEKHFAVKDGVRIGDRGDDDKVKRVQNGEQHENEKCVDDDIVDPVCL